MSWASDQRAATGGGWTHGRRGGRRGGQRLAQRQHLRARIPGRAHHAADRAQAPLLLEAADLELAGEAEGGRRLPPRQESLVPRWRADWLATSHKRRAHRRKR